MPIPLAVKGTYLTSSVRTPPSPCLSCMLALDWTREAQALNSGVAHDLVQVPRAVVLLWSAESVANCHGRATQACHKCGLYMMRPCLLSLLQLHLSTFFSLITYCLCYLRETCALPRTTDFFAAAESCLQRTITSSKHAS